MEPTEHELCGKISDAHYWAKEAERLKAELAKARGLVADMKRELDHCRLFVMTKEKIHPTGLELYDVLRDRAETLLKGE